MLRLPFCAALALLLATLVVAQDSSNPVDQALSQGDLYQSKHKYELALDAYHKADKLSHHSSAPCYMRLASVERKLGDFSSALDDAKHADLCLPSPKQTSAPQDVRFSTVRSNGI